MPGGAEGLRSCYLKFLLPSLKCLSPSPPRPFCKPGRRHVLRALGVCVAIQLFSYSATEAINVCADVTVFGKMHLRPSAGIVRRCLYSAYILRRLLVGDRETVISD